MGILQQMTLSLRSGDEKRFHDALGCRRWVIVYLVVTGNISALDVSMDVSAQVRGNGRVCTASRFRGAPCPKGVWICIGADQSAVGARSSSRPSPAVRIPCPSSARDAGVALSPGRSPK